MKRYLYTIGTTMFHSYMFRNFKDALVFQLAQLENDDAVHVEREGYEVVVGTKRGW